MPCNAIAWLICGVSIHSVFLQVAKEVSKLNRNIEAHEDKHPMISDSETNRPTVRTMPMSTFPPCAMMFDPSPKVSTLPSVLWQSRFNISIVFAVST